MSTVLKKISYKILELIFWLFFLIGIGFAIEVQGYAPVTLPYIVFDVLLTIFFISVFLPHPLSQILIDKRYTIPCGAFLALFGAFLYCSNFYELSCRGAHEKEEDVQSCITDLDKEYGSQLNFMWHVYVEKK